MELFEFVFKSMTTNCTIKLYAKTRDIADKCFLEIKDNTLVLEKKYNFYDDKSYLSREINNRKRNKISIDLQTYKILTQVRKLSEDTNGIFDITIGTLKECYEKDSISKVDMCLGKKKPYTGLDSWFLREKKLHFKDLRTLLNLGGVVKEYAVDESVQIAKKHGVQGFCLLIKR